MYISKFSYLNFIEYVNKIYNKVQFNFLNIYLDGNIIKYFMGFLLQVRFKQVRYM